MERGQYTKHRSNQRETILEAAEALFIEKGIDVVTITDIANASRMTRPTIYKYFQNKEEMATEIFRTISAGWALRNEQEVWSKAGTGFDFIECFLQSHFAHLLNTEREAHFMAEYNYLYARYWTVEKGLRAIRETMGDVTAKVFDSVKKGQQDGTIRDDMAADLLVASIFNFNSGMMIRLGELGAKIGDEFEVNTSDIIINIIDIFLDGLKPR